jgi:hypothetical protein
MKRFALCLSFAFVAGCSSIREGPLRIIDANGTFYTQRMRTPGFNEVGTWVHDTGEDVDRWVGKDAQVEVIDKATFDAEVARIRAEREQQLLRSRQVERDYRDEVYRKAQIRQSIYVKDWNRWYQRFLSDGYTEEEARYKADEIMRGR